MTYTHTRMAVTAVSKALQLRRKQGCTLAEPVCIYDFADRLGVDVRFVDIPSMEGMYVVAAGSIAIVSSLRPPGRQVFTTAHELGHHVLGHGEQFDELIDQRSDQRRRSPEEFQANCFAGALLMPKATVSRAFYVRKADPNTCEPVVFYVIATWLGVGYRTLVDHMQYALNAVSASRANELRSHRPVALRTMLLGRECRNHLVVADENWDGRAVDLAVDDIVLLPRDVELDGRCVEVIEQGSNRMVARAVTSGIGSARGLRLSTPIRVARKEYVGRACYRFEEDAD